MPVTERRDEFPAQLRLCHQRGRFQACLRLKATRRLDDIRKSIRCRAVNAPAQARWANCVRFSAEVIAALPAVGLLGPFMPPRASSCRFNPLHAVSRGGGHHPLHQLFGDRRRGGGAVRRRIERFFKELLHARRARRRNDDERPGGHRPRRSSVNAPCRVGCG